MYKVLPLALALSFGALSPAIAAPPFYSSVTSNDIDYIRTSDPSALICLRLLGRDRREMPHKSRSRLFADDVFVFEARYTDGRRLEFWADPRFRSETKALDTVHPVARSVGRLPTPMRTKLDHVVVNTGNHTANSEDQGRFFVVYDRNVKKRLGTHDLDETVFHESVHATLDIPHAKSRRWRQAQQSDKGFATGYAAENPGQEDLAETALIAYTLMTHPARLPPSVKRYMEQTIPDRLAALRHILPRNKAPAGPAQRLCK
ncbi:hypothetical protein [Pacificoceanicola onchidii]|uniref:hypothetical protein n=1 Tax=Pacificoceanicola onchidii TaxID=2562685 RepID=UPI0010A4A712|nr:hypothetical protein [Pacificoceanicola onchidii]